MLKVLALWLLVAATPGWANDMEGASIFRQTCAACHAVGVAGPAPKVGVHMDWDIRLTAGRFGLLRSVMFGKGAMPPKGGNASITDAQAKAALEYMLMKLDDRNMQR